MKPTGVWAKVGPGPLARYVVGRQFAGGSCRDGLFDTRKSLEELVIRRICLVGAALAAVPFAVGISGAAAATAPKSVVVNCHLFLTTVPPPGSPAVDQPPSKGAQYGPVRCNLLGFGVMQDFSKVPDSGDTVGKYWQYFGNGSIHGKFDLTPAESSGVLSSTSFSNEAWVGKVTVTGGTGAFAKVKVKKGVFKCKSGDTLHLTCTEKIKLIQM
jgi:hypothetical protein